MKLPSGTRRWMAVADNHGDEQDPSAVRAALAFADAFKPQDRFHLGDVFNFSWLRKNATHLERAQHTGQDVEAGCDFLRAYRPTHILWGNHDRRIFDRLTREVEGPVADLCSRIIADINAAIPKGCAILPYDKREGILEYGTHKFLHGYGSGIGFARKMALIYGNCVVGHIHTIDTTPVERHGETVVRCHSIGCLCNLDLVYNFSQVTTLRQEQGWAWGWKLPDGNLIIRQSRKIGNLWDTGDSAY